MESLSYCCDESVVFCDFLTTVPVLLQTLSVSLLISFKKLTESEHSEIFD